MKRTHKITLLLLLTLALCVAIACLCACTNGANGTDGKDGVNGTNGQNGKDGVNGKSAYEIWLDEGHTGSKTDFLNWLKGSNGIDGTNGKDGTDGQNGSDGDNGASAYQIWLDNGHNGTETEFLEWLKGQNGIDGTDGTNGVNGLSAYEIFVKQYPYYEDTEEQWLIALVNGNLKIHSITFKSEVSEDIVKYVVGGYDFTDVPEVPKKEGQTSAEWNVKDFTNVTQNIEVNAVYDMRKYVTFRNKFTDDEDVTITVNYGEAIENIPEITAKAYNDSRWSIKDFSNITEDMQVDAIYETQGLLFVPINQQTEYRVSRGEMHMGGTEELFIPAEHDGKPVTVIDTDAFHSGYSNGIKHVFIPSSIKELRDNAFKYCTSLIDVQIPDSVTVIGNYAFSYCSSLTSIVIPNNITSISDYAFYSCSSLTSIVIPNSVTVIGNSAFNGCSSLTSIVIPDSVTVIGNSAFNGCSSLTSIVIPDSVTVIENSAFNGCSSLTSIAIPNGITISWRIFENCTNLKYIVIECNEEYEYSGSAGYIGDNAFKGCSNLETVYYKGTQKQFDTLNIATGNSTFTDAMVYYYSETEPTDNGYYWHYDTDGVTPIIWKKEN